MFWRLFLLYLVEFPCSVVSQFISTVDEREREREREREFGNLWSNLSITPSLSFTDRLRHAHNPLKDDYSIIRFINTILLL